MSAAVSSPPAGRKILEEETRRAVQDGIPLPMVAFHGAHVAVQPEFSDQEAARIVVDFPDIAAVVEEHKETELSRLRFGCVMRDQPLSRRGPRPFRPSELRVATEPSNSLKAGVHWREPIAVVIDEEEDYSSFVGYCLHLEGFRVLICSTPEEIVAAGKTIEHEIAVGEADILREIEEARRALAELKTEAKAPKARTRGGEKLTKAEVEECEQVLQLAIEAATLARRCEKDVYALIVQDVMLQMTRQSEAWTYNLAAREKQFPQLFSRDHGVAAQVLIFSTNPYSSEVSEPESCWTALRRHVAQQLWEIPPAAPVDSRPAETSEWLSNQAYLDRLGESALMEKPLGGVYAVRKWIRRELAARTTFSDDGGLDRLRAELTAQARTPLKSRRINEHVEHLRAKVERVYQIRGPRDTSAEWNPLRGADQEDIRRGKHSATDEAQDRAKALIERARWLRENGRTPCDWARGALLAVQASEMLRRKTATLALEALTLQHQFEALTECRFFGVSYDFKVRDRLTDVREEVDKIAFSYKNRERAKAEAEGNLVNDLMLIYRAEGQFEAEASCLVALRSARRQVQPWPNNWLLAYFNAIVARGWVLAAVIFAHILASTAGFYLCIQNNHANGVPGTPNPFMMAIFCFFSVQPPPLPDGWQGFGFDRLSLVEMATILSGYLHLGVLISALYARFSRR